ncbi:MAG: AmmeMemoRadiSam system radical SAM enzyme [Thermodesulfobacteriota bacterium]|nr:AmmeMemoRadiSam system radical SAM enzyme [Thermodesulfobacteriota bacterium]
MDASRREFLKTGLCVAFGGSLLPWQGAWAREVASPTETHVKEAYFYKKLADDAVQCGNCPHACIVLPGHRGKCRTRENRGGRLFSISYGNPCVVNVDPIEKKPLLHFCPGTKAFSLAVAGCNFTCLNCQNWEISQTSPDKTRNYDLPPEDVAALAEEYGCKSIAYTYSEATTFYEYMVDISTEARKRGIKNIWVSNAYISQPALHRLCDVIDAASVNLKSFSDKIYWDLNGGHLEPVLETFKTLHRRGVWMEIINLVIPTYTDDMEMIKTMCGWILKNLGPEYPLHFSRFSPLYKLIHLPPTPVEVLKEAEAVALKEGLHHVYIGNVPGLGDKTVCPSCKETVIQRRGYRLLWNHVKDGKCSSCGTTISGRWG